jgi:hypothetical protein
MRLNCPEMPFKLAVTILKEELDFREVDSEAMIEVVESSKVFGITVKKGLLFRFKIC